MSADSTSGSFHGGIHPPERKHLSNQQPLRSARLPEEVVLPLGQHQGRLALPCVQVGDQVKTGQLLAKPQAANSACVHASLSGQVIALEERPVPHLSRLSLPAIVIQSDGQDTWIERSPRPDWQQSPQEELLLRLQNSGLVGLGGAVFPTRTKLASALKQGIHTLLINAAECEPYITADDLLMRSRPKALLEGIGILSNILQPRQLLFAIEDNKPEALAALQEALPGSGLEDSLTIRVLPTRYPSGGEKQLIEMLTGQEVPSGGLPLDLGILCHNVGTLAAIADAVVRGEPLVERIVTLTGEALARPGNYRVRIGTPIKQLLEEAGINAQKASRLLLGGPMMGLPLPSSELPVTKATNCLLVPTEEELPLPGPEQPCIRCGHCEDVCPARLLPQQLYFYAAHQAYEQTEEQQLFDCIECGACAWVCPSEIPLVQYYRHAKAEISQLRADAEKAEKARLRFESRQARLEREAAEKEAKRQARAKAAVKLKTQQEKTAQKQEKTAPDTASSAASAEVKKLKQLKIARSAALAAVRKAEKSLNNLQVSADALPEQVQEQENRLTAAREQLQKAEAKLAAANPPSEV